MPEVLLTTPERKRQTLGGVAGTTTIAAGIGTTVGTQLGEPMMGVAVTTILKWLGSVARDRLSLQPTGVAKYLWQLLALIG